MDDGLVVEALCYPVVSVWHFCSIEVGARSETSRRPLGCRIVRGPSKPRFIFMTVYTRGMVGGTLLLAG